MCIICGNLLRWNLSQTEEKDISILLNHIKILCNHEEETYDYFIKWMAQMVQYPAIKTTLVLFQGAEGCVKGRLFTIIEKLIGSSKYLESCNPERGMFGVTLTHPWRTRFLFISVNYPKNPLKKANKELKH